MIFVVIWPSSHPLAPESTNVGWGAVRDLKLGSILVLSPSCGSPSHPMSRPVQDYPVNDQSLTGSVATGVEPDF